MYPTKEMPGFGVFVKNVVEGLKSYKIEITHQAIIKGKGNNIWKKTVKYLQFYWSILVNYWGKYDLVYIHYPNMALPVFYPLFCCWRKKVVVNLHGEDLFYSGFIGSKLGHLNEKFLKKVNLIIVPSTFFKIELLKRHICDEKKIFISPSGGVDCERFYPYHIEKGKVLSLGFVGRIDPNKGWKEFVEVLKLLKTQLAFKAYIIGYGSQMKELVKLIMAYHLNDSVELIEGIRQEELVYYYNQFDLLVFSTQLPESLGLVGLEAMACGIPVVGTNIGGIATYLNNTNGYPVPKGSIMAMVNAIIAFSTLNKEEKSKLNQQALITAQKYNTHLVIENLYQKLLLLINE